MPDDAPTPEGATDPGRRRRWTYPIVGMLCGAVVAAVAVGASRFAGHFDLVRGLGGDAGSSFAGMRYFVHDSWHLPLLRTTGLRDPSGTPAVVAFTDSVPLLAITAKSLRFVGLTTEQWIAAWYIACVVLQGSAAGVVARVFRMRHWWMVAALALFASTAPVLLFRVVHPGLFAQFVLLLAWAVAGHFWHTRTARSLAWGIPVMVLALLVHPYLFLMVGVLVVGLAMSATLSRSITGAEAAVLGLVAAATLGVVMVLFGYLPNDSNAVGGYGAFGMPLLSPVLPQGSGLWPGARSFITNTSGSTDGFNYLGTGVIALSATALVVGRRSVRAFVLREQALVVVLGALTLFAISPVIYVTDATPLRPFGATLAEMLSTRSLVLVALSAMICAAVVASAIVHYKAWDRLRAAVLTALVLVVPVAALGVAHRSALVELLGQFRASGRCFWIVGYGIEIAAFVVVDRAAVRTQVLASCVAVALVLQLVDVRLFVVDASDRLVAGPERTASIDLLGRVIRAHDSVHLASEWSCTVGAAQLHAFQDVVIAASIADAPIDNYYRGWTVSGACPVSPRAAVDPDALTVVVAPSTADLDRMSAAGLACRHPTAVPASPVTLCSHRWESVPASTRSAFTPVGSRR